MAEASPANGLDLEKLLASGASKGTLSPEQFSAFAEVARRAVTTYEGFMQGLDAFLKLRGDLKDKAIKEEEMTLGLKLRAQPVIDQLTGTEGLIAQYGQMLTIAEQHNDPVSYGITLEVIRAYSRKMAKLDGAEFYPSAIAEQEMTATGSAAAETHTRNEGRRSAFKSFRALLQQQKVDYRLRSVLGENYERKLALEQKLFDASMGQQAIRDIAPPVQPNLTSKKPEGVEMWEGIVTYDPVHRRLGGRMNEFVTQYVTYVGMKDPDLNGTNGEEAQRVKMDKVRNLLASLVGTHAVKTNATELRCAVYVGSTVVTPHVEKVK